MAVECQPISARDCGRPGNYSAHAIHQVAGGGRWLALALAMSWSRLVAATRVGLRILALRVEAGQQHHQQRRNNSFITTTVADLILEIPPTRSTQANATFSPPLLAASAAVQASSRPGNSSICPNGVSLPSCTLGASGGRY